MSWEVDEIAAQASQSVIVYAPDGTVRSWNAASSALYGWPVGSVLGYRLDPLAATRWLPDVALAEGASWQGRLARRRADGAAIEVPVRLVAKGGAIVEYGPIPDALDAAPVEIAICEPENRFRLLLEHMPIALWQVDARSPGRAFEQLRAEGVTDIAAYLGEHPDLVEFACDTVMVHEVNRAAVRLFGGASEAEFLQPVRYIFGGTPSAAVRVMTAHFNGARTHVEELKIHTFDGRVLDVLFLVTYPQPPEDLAVSFISMIDITDRLRAEAELSRLQADFAHAARISTLGEMVASIAHEVKQPLTAIITNGAAGLRWLSRGDAPDRVAGRIERVIESAGHANEIIQRIQRMAAKRAPVWAELDINEVIDEALQFVRFESLEKQVQVVPRLDPALPAIRGDRVQLQQVLVNLLVNSFQAMDANHGRERVVEVRSAQAAGWVEISVSDTGPGIPPEAIDRVFDGFFTTKEAGMGIGLTICDSIVAAHGGSIAATNLAAGGTMIRFRLPGSGAAANDARGLPRLAAPDEAGPSARIGSSSV